MFSFNFIITNNTILLECLESMSSDGQNSLRDVSVSLGCISAPHDRYGHAGLHEELAAVEAGGR